MNYEKIKKLYLACRNIVDIIESGDIKDERYKLLIRTMRVEQLERIQTFVKNCEDLGFKYLND